MTSISVLTTSTVELGSYLAQLEAGGPSHVAVAGVVAAVVAASVAGVDGVAVPVAPVRALTSRRQAVERRPAPRAVAAPATGARISDPVRVRVAAGRRADSQPRHGHDDDGYGGLNTRSLHSAASDDVTSTCSLPPRTS